MRALIKVVGAFLIASGSVRAASTPLPAFDITPLENKAAVLFNADYLVQPGSALGTACDHLLLFCQAISALVIVAGLVASMRHEQTQMQGIAATLLKVAFIATVPLWRTIVLDVSNAMAGSVGYESVSAAGKSSAAMHDLWKLMEAWIPPGTPYLDVLQTQDPGNLPASGDEQNWGLNAWNWARGVGAADATLFHAMWQAASGSVRAAVVFGGTALMVCCLSVTLMLCYLGEMLRYLVFYGGCSLLPVFIAALSVDALRSASLKFITGTVVVAIWPIGWALGNLVTHPMSRALEIWMADVSRIALTAAGFEAPSVSLAVAAPYVSWGALLLFLGLTLGLCLWVVCALFGGPFLISRAAGAATVFVRASIDAVPIGAIRGSGSGWPSRRTDPVQSESPRVSSGTTLRPRTAEDRAGPPGHVAPRLRGGATLGSAAAGLRSLAPSPPVFRRRRE